MRCGTCETHCRASCSGPTSRASIFDQRQPTEKRHRVLGRDAQTATRRFLRKIGGLLRYRKQADALGIGTCDQFTPAPPASARLLRFAIIPECIFRMVQAIEIAALSKIIQFSLR